ncbi:cationic amino acid transporter 6, chloroplastic-like [Cucurbita moschata]|uniref:Cationic amino acid transporter 6, chloroplastic-like n=1 Tax=Cucurbita moschata TaxID=3662 RepID=A0A6J1H8Q5_CUCMO|nr:cationic amino acid transporter 6, chloroplastic-like [Cucurbita moschata]
MPSVALNSPPPIQTLTFQSRSYLHSAMDAHSSSFSSFSAYLRALSLTPSRLSRRAFSVSTSFDEMTSTRSTSGVHMHRTLRWFDLVGFGLGGMVGAGVFVTTGPAAHQAGPAIVLSYAIAGLCALLSAFCYTEFAVDMPVAGGAFSYLRITFGEFAGFLTGANLIMDYVMSNAAVARSFTQYLGAAIGISTAKWRLVVPGLPKGFDQIDLIAVAVVLIITIIICYSTKQSSVVNMTLTAIHILFIAFLIVFGFWKGDWKNFTEPGDPKNESGFFPHGATGVFKGASLVYLSYIGYDAVSTMAEEVRNPAKDIPVGVSGSVVLVTILYCLMAASMAKLLPYDMIKAEAPLAEAFARWKWVSNVIGGGASFGILTSLLVAMMGQARYMCVIGRSRVVPAWFAEVHPKTSTPLNASAFLGIFTAVIALFVDLDVLLNFVCIGTLFVFYMVANAIIYRRYVVIGSTKPQPTLSFLCSFSLTAIIFTLIWHFVTPGRAKTALLTVTAIVAIVVSLIFNCVVPQTRKPEFWGVPLMPWIPCASIFLNLFLLGSLDGMSYIRFVFFSILVVLVYVLYGVHSSSDAEGDDSLFVKNGEILELQNNFKV